MSPSHSKPSARARSSGRKKDTTAEHWLTRTLLAYLWSLGVALLLLLIASLLAYFTPDPAACVLPLGLCAAALTALISGGVAIRIHRQSPLTVALCNAALLSFTMLLLSFGFRANATGYAPWLSALLHAGFFLCSVAGAYLLRPRKSSTKKRRRKKRT